MANFQLVRKEAINSIDDTFDAHNEANSEANSEANFVRQPKARDGDPLIYKPSFRDDAFGLSFTFQKLNQGLCYERFDGFLNSKLMVTAFADGNAQATYFYHQNLESPEQSGWVEFVSETGAGALSLEDVPVEFRPTVGELDGFVGRLIGAYLT